VQNLDQICARFGYEIARQVHGVLGKGAENHITRSLAVLQEDGVYAFFLYQRSRGERERKGASKLEKQAGTLLKCAEIEPFDGTVDPLEAVRGGSETEGLSGDLDRLLLAKRLLEQALIYARYHAKALEE
jgi:hypothetical protein